MTALHAATLVLASALTMAACSSPPSATTAPVPASRESEPPVAVTVPSGPETLPAWQRQGSTSTLVLPTDVLFATDSADLSAAASGVLRGIVAEVRSRPGAPADVLVEGHADGDGDAGHNQDLSERRAASVAEWLTANGVDPSTVTSRGWGETRPVAEETDEAAKSQNRRVDVTVTPAATATEKEGTR